MVFSRDFNKDFENVIKELEQKSHLKELEIV